MRSKPQPPSCRGKAVLLRPVRKMTLKGMARMGRKPQKVRPEAMKPDSAFVSSRRPRTRWSIARQSRSRSGLLAVTAFVSSAMALRMDRMDSAVSRSCGKKSSKMPCSVFFQFSAFAGEFRRDHRVCRRSMNPANRPIRS